MSIGTSLHLDHKTPSQSPALKQLISFLLLQFPLNQRVSYISTLSREMQMELYILFSVSETMAPAESSTVLPTSTAHPNPGTLHQVTYTFVPPTNPLNLYFRNHNSSWDDTSSWDNTSSWHHNWILCVHPTSRHAPSFPHFITVPPTNPRFTHTHG